MGNDKFYWPGVGEKEPKICMSCGEDIDFNFEVGIMGIKENLTLREAERNKDNVEIIIFCSECGTNLELLYTLGIKRMVGTLEDSDKEAELAKIVGGRN
jgi:hypothetical protein